jgi:hypothetical protein
VPRRPVLGLLTTLLALTSLVAAPAAVAADRDCGDFGSQRAAQIFFLNQGGPGSDPHGLDSDGDGIACESNPAPYYYGTTPPGGGGGAPDPQPQITAVRSTVHLVLDPNKRIAGESFRIEVSVRPAISRKVVVQRKDNGHWKVMATGVTGRNGITSGVFKALKATMTYRAVVQPVTVGNKKYSAATSQARAVGIQRQRVVLSFGDRTVAQGEQARALVRATPIRAGRTVVLQMRSAGTWRTVRSSTFDRRGRATFTFTPELGQDSYRAVAQRHRGASPEQSNTETLTATDITPPPAPYDLIAVPGDGAVRLSWSRAIPSDFDHHEVWMRTADTTWSLVTVTESDNVEVTLLQNDVTYWCTVTSVDSNGNVSEMADEVAATPSAPVSANQLGG